VTVNALLAMVPGDAMGLPPELIMSIGVWVTGLEPELVSVTLEKEAEPKSAKVDC
jgi:hypothetical protein